VGAVEVQEITTGTEYDRVAVLVKWSASNCWLEPRGRIRGCGPQTIRPQLFNLVRKAGVQTVASMGLHSAHCTGCGAPYTDNDSGQCEYCGRLLNDGSGSWVLESITAFTGSRVNAARVSPVSGNSGASPDILLLAMAGVMHADGKMDPEEIRTLEDFASHRGISRERLDVILATVSENGEGIPAPHNSAEAMEILRAMIRMSLSDGTIDGGEKSVLEAYARKAGLSGGAVSSEINRQRKKLYREVKESGN
jgi:tellurite resistance protein